MINSRSRIYLPVAKIMGLSLLFLLVLSSFRAPASEGFLKARAQMIEAQRRGPPPISTAAPSPYTFGQPATTPIAASRGYTFGQTPEPPTTPTLGIFGTSTRTPPLPSYLSAPALNSPYGASTLPQSIHSPFTPQSLGGFSSTAKEDLTRESAAYKQRIALETTTLRSKILASRAETFTNYMLKMRPRIAKLKPLEATDPKAKQLIQDLQNYPTVVANLNYLQLMNQQVEKLEASNNIYLLDMATELKQGINLKQEIQNLKKEKTKLERKINANQAPYVTQNTIKPFTNIASNVAAFTKSEEEKLEKQLAQLRAALIDEFPLVDRALAQLKTDGQKLINLQSKIERLREEANNIAQKNANYRRAYPNPAELEKYLKENQNTSVKQDLDQEQSLRYQFERANAEYQAYLAKAAENQGFFKTMWQVVVNNKAITTIVVGGLIFSIIMLALSGDDKSGSKGSADLDVLKKRLTALDISPSLYTDAQLDIVLQKMSALGYTIATVSDANLKSLLTSLGSASSNPKAPAPANSSGTEPFASPGLSNYLDNTTPTWPN